MTLIHVITAWVISIAPAQWAAGWLCPPLAVVGLVALLALATRPLWRNDPRVRRMTAGSVFLLFASVPYALFLPHVAGSGHVTKAPAPRPYAGRE